MKHTFSELTSQHIDQVIEIENQSFQEPWSRDGFRDLISNARYDAIGLFVGSKLAGYLFSYSVVDEVHIMNVAVHPSFRKQNLATLLLEHVHSQSRKKGGKVAYLEVRETNEAAQALYRKLGYEKQGRRIGYYSNQEDALLMCKQL
jgi:ribosomal-protein-alanine N-acetyltransferase